MKLLLMGCILVLTGISVAAQNIPGMLKEHVITAGTGFKKLKDQYVLPYSAEGNVMNIGYSFLRSGEMQRKIVAAEWSHSSLSGNVKVNDFRLHFAQAFSLIKSRNKRWNGFLGYSFHTAPSFILVNDKQGKKYSWSTSTGLSLYQSVVYTTGRNRLTLDVHIPVIGLASRPEEKDYYHHTVNGVLYDSYSDLFFSSWHNQRAVSASLDFSTTLSKEIRVMLGGRYHYNRLEKENVYKESKIGLYAGVACSFK